MAISTDTAQAVAILQAGGLVAFPTETVYGLGADASNARAVANIFAVKERPLNHPLIVHIPNINHLDKWARDIPEYALMLANHFWPGPLTLIVPKQASVLACVTGGQDSVGLRVPAHPVAQLVLQQFGSGIAAPSANQYLRISPTSAADVAAELGDKVDLILEGGDCDLGLESTILDCTDDAPTLLRAGMLNVKYLEQVLAAPIKRFPSAIRVSGSGLMHYAPRTPTQLLRRPFSPPFKQKPVAILQWSNQRELPNSQVNIITMPTEAPAYARMLYRQLRAADHGQFSCIYIEDVPESDEWLAIRDRIYKACAIAHH